jgi:hypothetical protein
MGLLKRDAEPLKISLMSSDFPRLWEHPCEVNPPVDNNCQRRKLFQEEKREGIRIYSRRNSRDLQGSRHDPQP